MKKCKRCEVSGYIKQLNNVGLCNLCVQEIAEGMKYPEGAYALVRNQEGNVVFLFRQDLEAYKQRTAAAFGLMEGGVKC